MSDLDLLKHVEKGLETLDAQERLYFLDDVEVTFPNIDLSGNFTVRTFVRSDYPNVEDMLSFTTGLMTQLFSELTNNDACETVTHQKYLLDENRIATEAKLLDYVS